MENKKYTMIEILGTAAKMLQDPEDKKALEDFETMKNCLAVKEYMTMYEKELNLENSLVYLVSDEIRGYNIAVSQEKAFVFCCVMPYIVNMDKEYPSELVDFGNLDILEISGIIKYIESVAKRDIDRMREMFDRMLSWESMIKMNKIADKFDSKEVMKLQKAVEEWQAKLPDETIKNLARIAQMNDPSIEKEEKIEEKAIEKLTE